ncbi:MAG: hypothetical protein IKC32_01720 [Clostridia bacterium]|nr:hypothetical protein [Clostridia bacterium]
MSTKKIIITVIVAILLLAAILAALLAMSLYGNPVSLALARVGAEAYLDKSYEGKGLVIERVGYDFKFGKYFAYAELPGSMDIRFSIIMNASGEVIRDEYENHVTSGWNTSRRIDNEYRKLVDAVLISDKFNYDYHIGYGMIAFFDAEYKDEYTQSYAIDMASLTCDADYDPSEIGAEAGEITLYIYDEAPSAEKISEILLDIKEILSEADVGFHAIDIVLEKEDGGDEDRLEIRSFLCSDIYVLDMLSRVEDAIERTNDYYAEMDKEKQEQIE